MSSSTCTNCSGEMWMESTRARTTRISHFQARQYVPGQQETLLTLPAEIRARIWNFVYNVEPTYWTEAREACITCGSIPCQSLRVEIQHAPHKAATTSVLASLRTCRLIHDEAAHLFYSINLLSLSSPAALYHFLSTLSPRLRQNISALHVANVSPSHWTTASIAPQAFSSLALCSRLRDFFVDFSVLVDDEHPALWGQAEVDRRNRADRAAGTPVGKEFTLDIPFDKAMFALSQQRNFLRLGFRGCSGGAVFSHTNAAEMVESQRPYSFEDMILNEIKRAQIDQLRAQVQQPRLQPSTRYERARSALRGPSRYQGEKQLQPARLEDDGIRPTNTEESQQMNKYQIQKTMVKHFFDSGPNKRRRDENDLLYL